MDRENMKLLSKLDYCVCEKTDGVRYMLLIWNVLWSEYLLILQKLFYFIDRKHKFYLLKNTNFTETISFLADPSNPNCIDLNKATVLDGEFLVESKDPAQPLCYWVFDIVCFNNKTVKNLSLLHRLQIIRTCVTNPLNLAVQSQKLQLPFQMRYKPMYNLKQTVFVWNDVRVSLQFQRDVNLFQVVPHLSHESDGLIFTPILDPYTAGTCPKLLKWKPLHLNSADFKIAFEYISKQYYINLNLIYFPFYTLDGKKQYRLQVLKQGFDANYDWLSLETEEEEKEYGRNHLVVECILDFVFNCM